MMARMMANTLIRCRQMPRTTGSQLAELSLPEQPDSAVLDRDFNAVYIATRVYATKVSRRAYSSAMMLQLHMSREISLM
jgi:hypothetical protein